MRIRPNCHWLCLDECYSRCKGLAEKKGKQKKRKVGGVCYFLNFCSFCSISLSPSASPAHVAIMPSTRPSSFAAVSSTWSIVVVTGHPIIFTVSTFLGVPTKKYE